LQVFELFINFCKDGKVFKKKVSGIFVSGAGIPFPLCDNRKIDIEFYMVGCIWFRTNRAVERMHSSFLAPTLSLFLHFWQWSNHQKSENHPTYISQCWFDVY